MTALGVQNFRHRVQGEHFQIMLLNKSKVETICVFSKSLITETLRNKAKVAIDH